MKRTQAYFLVAVWGALGMGFLLAHYKTREPESRVFATGEIVVELPSLVVPRGETELEGLVYLADGTPAEDCEVFLYAAELEPGTAAPLHWTFTDERGAFGFQELEVGSFEVVLLTTKTPPTRISLQLPVDGPVTWTLNPEIPPLPVLPELERTSIAGRIHLPGSLSPTDHPLKGYEVRLVPLEGTTPLSGAVDRREKTDSLGNFHFPQVAHGDYRFEVLPPWARGGTWPVLARRPITAGQNLSAALEVPLAMGALRGTVTNTEDYPIEGALVMLFPLAEDGSPGPKGRFWPPASTDSRGRFLVGELSEGLYRLRVKAGEAAFETRTRIRAGETSEVLVEPLDPRPTD